MINLNHVRVEHPQETHLTNNVSADHAHLPIRKKTPQYNHGYHIRFSDHSTDSCFILTNQNGYMSHKLLMVSLVVLFNMASTLSFLLECGFSDFIHDKRYDVIFHECLL
ncbi:MAG: hypothetical protein IKE94_16165 [Aeriscardovia sp.]|nr:hypothetical protein [Aeriscardovia sp.]